MSEVQSRPPAPRGRGSTRGGRGNYSSRGARGRNRQTNGDRSDPAPEASNEDESEIGLLKKQHSSELNTIKEMFPDWTEEDIVFALQETDGNLESTIEQITEGNISRWGEVKKKSKDRSHSKVKDAVTPPVELTSGASRGMRGRGGLEAGRGRGRGVERGRGGGRGGRGASTINSIRGQGSNNPPGPEMSGWNADTPRTEAVAEDGNQPAEASSSVAQGKRENSLVSEPAKPEEPKASLKPDGTRSWASIFNKPTPAPAPQTAPLPLPSESIQAEKISDPQPTLEEYDEPGLPPPKPLEETPNTPPTPVAVASEPARDITPSKDELTETNLEQVFDASQPPPTATAASTIASTQDLRTGAGSATPLPSSHQQTMSRPPLGGYATSAYKATGAPSRSASFQRKVMEQREAVIMPANHAVDRAAVQFGSMGLKGASEDLDVDVKREDAETRAQPPQHSPNAPRATLPPATLQQAYPTQTSLSESVSTPRQAPGLPPVTHQPGQISDSEQATLQQPTPGAYSYNQFNNRYGPQASLPEPTAPAQKAFEPFGHQAQQPQTQQHQFDGYPPHAQVQSQPPQQVQAQAAAISSANDYQSHYTSDTQRSAYQNFYGNYAPQAQNSQQDTGVAQTRSGSAFTSTAADSAALYATTQAQQSQSRYGQATEAQASGHTTPNPAFHGQQQQSQSQQPHQMPQQPQGQSSGQGGYPYGHPYYNSSPYYQQYMNQVSHHSYGRERPMFDDVRRYEDQFLTSNHQFGYGNQGYGGPYGGKQQGMYGQPHQGYGMSPQSSYEHSSSPANVGGFGQHSGPGRDSVTSGGLVGYGRTGSTQPPESQQHSTPGGAFGNTSDVFGRSQSSFPNQNQNLGQQHGGQQSGNEDSARAYGDPKALSVPSPALGQPGRPGSAVNHIPGQAGLPPPQSQGQQGYGGYPNHMNHHLQHGQQGSQYGAGVGSLGSHHQSNVQNHQGSGYGTYGAGGFGGSYYGGNRGGWGGNYGH